MHRLTATDTPMVRYTRTIFPSYAYPLLVLSIQYARVYLDGNLQMWVDAEDSLTL